MCGSRRPRRNKPRRGGASAVAAAGSFALGALALGLLVIARRRRRLVPVDRLRRRGRVRRVHRLVERGIEPRLLALGIALEAAGDRFVLPGVALAPVATVFGRIGIAPRSRPAARRLFSGPTSEGRRVGKAWV